jgi:curved DNA-binding protein CbpA
VPTFYQLLSLEPTATPAEIKRAFRNEIARYHPDKVHHLGKEFQEMAATRAAALTEAYRTLMDASLRAEYDRVHVSGTTPADGPGSPSHEPFRSAPAESRDSGPSAPAQAEAASPPRFASEHRDRDDFVRKATLGRFRTALAAEVGVMEASPTRGFDLDFTVKSKKLFSRTDNQRFAVKVVARVDRLAVQDTWGAALRAGSPICVFLVGNRIAPAKELSAAIADLRNRTRGGAGISLIPIDVRDWTALIPSDVPDSCRNVLKRLRDASSV